MLDIAVAVSPLILVTLNVAVLLPAATVTVLTDKVAAAVLPLATWTTTPPVGAVVSNVTVAVEVDAVPLGSLVTVVGFSVTEEIAGGFTVSTEVCCEPLYAAEIVEVVWAPTAAVVTRNVAVVAFAATVTLAGTVAAAVLLLASVTTVPPVGAGPFSVTVAVGFGVVPPCTAFVLSPSDVTPVAGGSTVSVAF
jgi:hypothetical protein